MCGILLTTTPSTKEAFTSALTQFASRGPDGSGTAQVGGCSMGHTRLSIIDLSDKGHQPMSNEDGSLRMVCNGEIYNAPRLRTELERAGHVFTSQSDNEVILHGYEEWGKGCLGRLQGMFAFAIHALHTDTVFAARDHVGIKPLCYAHTQDGLLLASDTRAIVDLLPQPNINRQAVCYMLTLGYIPAPLTIWEDISKLEPGHCLTFKNKKINIERYWSPPDVLDPNLDPEDFPNLFEEVIRDHLLADVPVGLFLSGGLDSSAIAHAMHQASASPRAYTVQTGDGDNDETPVAAAVAAALNLEHTIGKVDDIDLWTLMPETAKAFDEPQGYSALHSMMLVSKHATRHGKVVLAGDGGDEVFCGYNWYATPFTQPGLLTRLFKRTKPATTWPQFALQSPLAAHARQLFPRFFPQEAAALLKTDFNIKAMLAPLKKHYIPSMGPVRALQRVDLMTFCTDSILAKVDRASMYHSLEVRVPFLDKRIIEFGLALPQTVNPLNESKPVIRKYLEQQKTARPVLEHPKQGFSLRCLRTFDWDRAKREINSGTLRTSKIIASNWEKTTPMTNNGRIWTLLQLEMWAREWMR